MKINFKYLVLLCFCLVTLPLHSKDYYSRKASVKGKCNEYVVKNIEDVAVEIWNKKNKYPIYTSFPYFKDTKEELKTTPPLEPDVNVMTEILDTIFTAEERTAYNATTDFIEICLSVDPLTGKVIEVSCIALNYCVDEDDNDKVLLSIPITKLERLEQLIIQRVVLDIPEEYKTANFVPVWFTIFDNRTSIFSD